MCVLLIIIIYYCYRLVLDCYLASIVVVPSKMSNCIIGWSSSFVLIGSSHPRDHSKFVMCKKWRHYYQTDC